jgi:hypothetical protein
MCLKDRAGRWGQIGPLLGNRLTGRLRIGVHRDSLSRCLVKLACHNIERHTERLLRFGRLFLFNLPKTVTISVPSVLSPDSYQDFADRIQILLRGLKRRSDAEESLKE